jgi:hypothetical protein
MRFIRSFIATLVVIALVVPNVAFAGTSTADLEKQILALKRQMEVLSRENAVQQRKIDRLEHRMAAAPAKTIKKPRIKVVAKHSTMTPSTARSVGFSSTPIAQFANETTGMPKNGYQPPATTETQSPSTSIGKQGPAQGSVQSVYEQQNALFTKGLTITPGATYTYGDNRFFTLNGFMALGAIFLGNINVSRQQNTVFTPNINLSYGASKRLQFDMTVPFTMRSSTYSSAGAQNSSQQVTEATVKNAGLGDINAGFFYQLPQRRLNGPIVVVNGHVTAPTGSQPYGIKVVQAASNDNLSYAKGLPTGAGVWGVSAGASIIKTVDPAILFAGATVFYNIQKHFSDISPYQGTTTPGTIAPGSALSLNIGTAFSLNDRMSATFGFQDTIVGSERLRADNGPWQTVGGSSVNAAVFNIGTTYAINHHTSWQAMLGIGVTHDAPSFQFSMRFPHGPGN